MGAATFTLSETGKSFLFHLFSVNTEVSLRLAGRDVRLLGSPLAPNETTVPGGQRPRRHAKHPQGIWESLSQDLRHCRHPLHYSHFPYQYQIQ
jgi:hypothetical protein